MKKCESLMPQYFNKFKCIGGACEDTCCAGWNVTIEEETYKKYRRVKDRRLINKLDAYVIKNRSTPSSINMAKMKLVDNKCGFLNKDGLCDIHATLGEDYLCHTCKEYPRVHNKINNTVECSLTLSCPEAARLILLNQEGIEFDVNMSEFKSNLLFTKSMTTDCESPMSWKDYLWDIRVFTIGALQNRNHSLDQRLLIIGLFFKKFDDYVKLNKLDELSNLISQYELILQGKGINEQFANIPTNNELQLMFCKKIIEYKVSAGSTSSRYMECVEQMKKGLKFDQDELDITQLTENYNHIYQSFYKPFVNNHSYLLENYLVNYVFEKCFPNEKETPFESYIGLVLQYAIIKFHLVGMSGYSENLSTADVVKLIQSFSKTFNHNHEFMLSILDLINNNNYANLATMTILIKN